MNNESEFYIVIDIEAAGPTPEQNAMLSLGAASLSKTGQTFYRELQPDSQTVDQQALAISNLSMDSLQKHGTPPEQVMREFADWVQKVTPKGKIPVFTAFNAPFDWMFVNTYFHRYLGYNPFGHKALDIKALFMGLRKVPFLDTSHYQVCSYFGMNSSLTHHALEDAVQEAEILSLILNELS